MNDDEDFSESESAQNSVSYAISSSGKRYSHQYPDTTLDIHIEVPEVDDFELFGRWASGPEKQKKERVFRYFYNLACCCAFESLAVTEQRVGSKEKWNILCTKFRTVLTGFPLIESNREGCLKFFPDQTWPDGFLEFCSQQHQKVTQTFLRLNPSMKDATPEDQLMWFTGSRVEDRAKECKEVINNRLNPAWLDTLPSGCTQTAFLIALRRTLWHDFCLDAARQSVRARTTVKLKGGEPSLRLSEEFTRDDAIEAAYVSKMAGMSDEWYPDCWVAFICMGRPAGDQKMSPLFNSGLPTKSFSQGLCPHDAVLATGGRDARRNYHRSLQQTTPVRKRKQIDPPSSGSSGSSSVPVETRVRILLQAEVKVLADMKAGGDDSSDLEEDLKATRLRLRAALKNERQALTGEYEEQLDMFSAEI